MPRTLANALGCNLGDACIEKRITHAERLGMTQFFGIRRLEGPDDWQGIAGADKWVPTRSAYELAYSWHTAQGIPTDIARCIRESNHAVLSGLKLEIGLVEKPVFLDTMAAPSMTDIMGYAKNHARETVVVAVEGKATEPFGLPIGSWIRGDKLLHEPAAEPRPTRVRRLKYLAERLGLAPDVESRLQYQLLHRTVSALSEAQLHGAAAAMLLVHSFAPEDHVNWHAYEQFIGALGGGSPNKRVVVGPLATPDRDRLPLFALWWDDVPRTPVASKDLDEQS